VTVDIVDPAIEAYAEAHTTPMPSYLDELADETRRDFKLAQMMVGPLEGRYLQALVYALRPQVVLEIGTFTGYSSISMAAALPDGARIITCDVDEVSNAVARRYAEASGLADRIEFRLGPALETIASLDGPFGFVFIDADKVSYAAYLDAVLPKLADGGLIAVDNTLWYGRPIDPSVDDPDTEAIRAFNDAVAARADLIVVQTTVRDGVTLIRKA
jgi:caffeoyl-CoA O-methyltransferase